MRAWIGLTLGASAAALAFIAWSTTYEAATLGGGERLHASFVLGGIAAAAIFGFFVGVESGRRRTKRT